MRHHQTMGFQTSPADPSKPPKVVLRSVSKTTFALVTPFSYLSAAGDTYEVPAHPNEWADATDLASVPPVLWGLLASYGRQLRAAILHDHLCDKVNRAVDERSGTPYADRRLADDLFREAMRDQGDGTSQDLQKRVPWFRSWLFWAGVSFGRYWKFRKVRAALMTAQVLVGTLLLDFLVPLPLLDWVKHQLPWQLDRPVFAALVWAMSLALSVVWWRDWRVPVIGLLAGPLVLPVLIITVIVQVVIGIPDGLLHALKGDQPVGNYGPTVDKTQRPAAGPASPEASKR